MHTLSAQKLLGVWERGMTQPPLARALSLLFAACSDDSWDSLMQLNIGQRNARLLTLRESMFGSRLDALATCPGCGERLDLDFSTAAIRVEAGDQASEFSLTIENYQLRLRLPNSQDLYAVADQNDPVSARRMLLENCVLSIEPPGEPCAADTLPASVVQAIAERMAQADPQANVQLALACCYCGREWQATFDIVSFFWSEIHAWALRILREVHVIASAYSWREADILALTPQRRQIYLDMIGAA